MQPLKRIGITGHYANQLAKKKAKEAIKEIKKHNVDCIIDRGFSIDSEGIALNKFECDMVLCFGGDGSLLHTARNLGKQIPIMGINCGDVGYLTQIAVDELTKELHKIIHGNYQVEERTRLGVKNISKIPLALNEYELVPSKSSTLIGYELYINGEFVFRDEGDGVIIATATGSTGHALSARGSIIYDNSKIISIVPINSNKRDTRPMVVGEDVEIKLSNYAEETNCDLVIDGQRRVQVENELIIAKAESVLFAKLVKK